MTSISADQSIAQTIFICGSWVGRAKAKEWAIGKTSIKEVSGPGEAKEGAVGKTSSKEVSGPGEAKESDNGSRIASKGDLFPGEAIWQWCLIK